MSKYFYCYSNNLCHFFIKNGLNYIASSINHNTGKKFWVFESCDQITILLTEWRLNIRISIIPPRQEGMIPTQVILYLPIFLSRS